MIINQLAGIVLINNRHICNSLAKRQALVSFLSVNLDNLDYSSNFDPPPPTHRCSGNGKRAVRPLLGYLSREWCLSAHDNYIQQPRPAPATLLAASRLLSAS